MRYSGRIFPIPFQMELWGAAIITCHLTSWTSWVRKKMQCPSPHPTDKHCALKCLTYLQVTEHPSFTPKEILLKLSTITPEHLYNVKQVRFSVFRILFWFLSSPSNFFKYMKRSESSKHLCMP